MNLVPIADRIIVKKIEEEKKTAGGLVLSDYHKDPVSKGIVLAVGDGALDDKGNRKPIGIEKDSLVLFAAHSGVEVKVDGENILILNQKDVLAVSKE